MFVVLWCLALWLGCLVLCGPSYLCYLLFVVLYGHQCTSAREWSVHSHLRWGLSVVCSWCTVCSVVCPCQLFCSVWMWCLEEVYRCLLLWYVLLVLLMCTLTIWSSVLCVCNVISNECKEPTSCLVQPIGAHCCDVMCFGFRGDLGFLNCDDVCMCVVNKQFELLEFVSESVYVDLQYDEISLTFTAGFVWC